MPLQKEPVTGYKHIKQSLYFEYFSLARRRDLPVAVVCVGVVLELIGTGTN